MKLYEIIAYHGTSQRFQALKFPLFVTTDKGGAQWFATERSHGQGGIIISGELNVKNPLKIEDGGYHILLDILNTLGIEFEQHPYFYCAEIKKFSPYDGANFVDVVFIPLVQRELQKRGYDSVHLFDVLENTSIETYVLFDKSQFIPNSDS
jgi:hypothetical protein